MEYPCQIDYSPNHYLCKQCECKEECAKKKIVNVKFPLIAGLLIRKSIRQYWEMFKFQHPDIPLVWYEEKGIIDSAFYFKATCTLAQAKIIEAAYNDLVKQF